MDCDADPHSESTLEAIPTAVTAVVMVMAAEAASSALSSLPRDWPQIQRMYSVQDLVGYVVSCDRPPD